MSLAIKIENLSKAYQIGEFTTGTLSRDLERWWALMRGKEDPFLKIGETNVRSQKGDSNVVWSLRDLNLEVEQGDVLGIIGKNGAGKSTLLKILSQVTTPTKGTIKMRGRVASLLEVGTGFHPELTGKENIYLNGAILGMTKAEVKKKFDEIVDFAGVKRYIDTPVKRYSSGMYVRLAFAVAAHLDSEILIVDEVLSVGDAEFQKKCVGKMGDISASEGRTILFVSHVMASVKQLCPNSIILEDGEISYFGNSSDAIQKYLTDHKNGRQLSSTYHNNIEKRGKDVEILQACLLNKDNDHISEIDISEPIFLKLDLNCNKVVPNIYGYINIKNQDGDIIVESDSMDLSPNKLENLNLGTNLFKIEIPPYILPVGVCRIYLSFAANYGDSDTLDSPGDILELRIYDHSTSRSENRKAKTSCVLKWERL